MKFVSSLGRTLHHTGYPLRGRVKRTRGEAALDRDLGELTRADLEPGNAFKAGEKVHFVNVCTAAFNAYAAGNKMAFVSERNADMCECLADGADDELSRFDRLSLQFGLQQKDVHVRYLESRLHKMGLTSAEQSEVMSDRTRRDNTVSRRCQERFTSR